MLKKTSFLALMMLAVFVFAQTPEQAASRKIIHVNGSAEMEIVPDEIYFSIALEEYVENKIKTDIASLEEQLKAAVTAAGVENKNLEIEKVYGQTWVRRKRKQDEFIEKKIYRLKLSDPSKIDAVLDKVDARGIDKVYISSYSHSKILEYRKQLKIEAIKNAKEKAKYLLEAIGEQLGGAVYINENDNGTPLVWNVASSSSSYEQQAYYSNSMTKFDSDKISSIGFKSIKLRFEVAVDFQIK